MDLTASVLEHLRNKDNVARPHHFFQRFENVVWLNHLERLISMQYLHPFDRTKSLIRARVRRGPMFWQILNNAAQLVPNATMYLPSVLRPHRPPAPFQILAVRHTPFRVSMGVFFYPLSGTLVIALTGLRSRSVGVGVAVTCHTALEPFADVSKRLVNMAPLKGSTLASAQVHAGIASLLPHFVKSRAWAAVVHAVQQPSVRHVVMTGFSLGGAMTHFLSQLLRVQVLHKMQEAAPPLLVVVEGAPRTGDTQWAHSFAERSDKFAHLNLVAAGRLGGETGAIEVDEVTTMPLNSNGFQSCTPLVAVVDGHHVQPTFQHAPKAAPPVAFSAPKLATKDLWNMTTRASLCLGSINFLRGFSHKHKLVLQ